MNECIVAQFLLRYSVIWLYWFVVKFILITWTVAEQVIQYEDLVDAKVKIETPEVVSEVDPEILVAAEPAEEPTEPAPKRRRGSQQKSYCCDVCGVSFTAARDLRVHLRGHDGSLLPSYECCECKRSFLWPSHLERHMRTHTGDRPYTCYACDRQFAQVGIFHLYSNYSVTVILM